VIFTRKRAKSSFRIYIIIWFVEVSIMLTRYLRTKSVTKTFEEFINNSFGVIKENILHYTRWIFYDANL